METIRVPIRFKENLEKRFDSKYFQKKQYGFENRVHCLLCQEYRYWCTKYPSKIQNISESETGPVPYQEHESHLMHCPFKKLTGDLLAGCTNFLQQVSNTLGVRRYIILTKGAVYVYTSNLEEFEKVIKHASKYIEFY